MTLRFKKIKIITSSLLGIGSLMPVSSFYNKANNGNYSVNGFHQSASQLINENSARQVNQDSNWIDASTDYIPTHSNKFVQDAKNTTNKPETHTVADNYE